MTNFKNTIRSFSYFFLSSFIFFVVSIFSSYGQQMPKKMRDKASAKPDMQAHQGDMMSNAGLIPSGIMIGEAKKWMVGYQGVFEKMDGNLVESNRISEAKILQQFMATPTDMTMEMHMGMAMYAPSDKFALMMMVPYIRKSMNHIMSTGMRFNELTKGIGDIELRGLYSVSQSKNFRNRLLLNFGVALPTGSINKRMGNMRLEYPMQLGSGTVALSPGITYLMQAKPWGWGAEFIPILQIGKNKNGYKLGNVYKPNIWVARQLTDWLSISAKVNAEISEKIKGADATLDIMDEPTKDPTLQGGKRIDLTPGANIHPTGGFLKSSQFFIDYSKPVIQSLNGPQLQKRSVVNLIWQREF